LPDGTKFVSSVRFGSVSQIRPGQPAEVIAAGIPSAASMGYDPKQKRLIIPMNNNNALAFIKLTDGALPQSEKQTLIDRERGRLCLASGGNVSRNRFMGDRS
jgi:hypothetical protein